MRTIILGFFVLACSSCVSSQKYSERSAFLLNELAEEVSFLYPNNQRLQNIAGKTGTHAEESGGLDFSLIVQLIALIGGGGTLTAIGLATAGVISPGVKLGKKKEVVA